MDPATGTYYEHYAYRAKGDFTSASVDSLMVRPPFRVDGVEDLRLDLKTLPQSGVVSGSSCQRSVLTFSYTLKLSIQKTNVSLPGRVDGSAEFCLTPASNALQLPFGHGIEVKSGLSQVDAAIAERLANLKGAPLARLLKVTRRIENGEPVSATSVLLLTDLREAVVPADRFELPGNYRFQEPALVAPVRKHP